MFPPLVARAQNGSLEAFRDLVVVFQDRVFALAVALCLDAERAREAAVEAFVRAHGTLHLLTDVNQVPLWLRDHVLRTSSPAPLPESDLLALLASLPHDQERTATALARIAGQNDARVAELLDLPVATVHNRLDIARRRLKRRTWRELREHFASRRPSASPDFADAVVARVAPS